MSKKAKPEVPNSDESERLEKLNMDWMATPHASGDFGVADLRLMLERFTPLRELVRSIVATETNTEAAHDPSSHEPAAVKEVQANEEAQKLQQDLEQAKQLLTASAKDLENCAAKGKELDKKAKGLETERNRLLKQLEQCKTELTAANARYSNLPALTLLRADKPLANSMGLAVIPDDDIHALIQIVSVLSQRDNIQRLWETLKNRCESDKRAATGDERLLLESALTWHNHNWSSLPYQLILGAPSSRYDYQKQMRSRHITKGETVAALLLPGIADGSGNVLCKALVLTK